MTYTGTSRLADFMRGLGALAVFMVLLVGFPIGLYAIAGSPIPDRIPSWEAISTILMRPDYDNRVFLTIFTLICWGTWCLLVLTSIAEVIGFLAERSTSGLPRPIRPLQQLIRDLVATAALTFSTAASIAGSASATTPPQAATGVHPEPGTTGHRSAEPSEPAASPPGSDWTPLLADQAPPVQEPEHPWRTRTVEQGDTLWDIARRTYGSGVLYPKIFESSQGIDQPDGLPPLTDPDVLHPGQRIRLPRLGEPSDAPSSPRTTSSDTTADSRPTDQDKTGATRTPAPPRSPLAKTTPTQIPSPVVAPPAEHPTSPAHPTLHDQNDHHSPLAISLPSGSRIGLGLAATLSVAVAATRLHRRRRRPLNTDPGSFGSTTEPPLPAPVLKARQAHMSTYTDHEAPAPSDPELIRRDLPAAEPDNIVIGTRGNHTVAVSLPGLSLGLSGDGAHPAARAITTELLPKTRRYRAEIVIPQTDAQALFPGTDITGLAAALEGLITTPSLKEAIEHLETELLRRTRLRQMAELPDVPALRIDDPAEPLPTMLLVAAVPAQDAATVHALATLGRRHSIGALLLGVCAPGTSLNLASDGVVTGADGPDADQFTGARLFHLTADDASGMLQTIQAATGTEPDVSPPTASTDTPPEPAPESAASLVPSPRPSQSHQAPAHLQVLGPVLLHTSNGPITSGLRKSAKQLLAYLALHPNGVTRDQATGALWPDLTPESAVIQFNTATTNIRKVLRAVTGLTEPKYILHAAGQYRIDPDLIDVDLWQLTTTLMDAERAADDTERINTLASVSDIYTGGFASGYEHEWANAHREYLRRAVVDALSYFVQLTQETQPERALAALERAITHDPYSEPVYRNVMRLQARLDRPDAVRRTYQLLASRLDEIDAEPHEDTHQLMAALGCPKPTFRGNDDKSTSSAGK
ncbi:BTAD domain-containing putative transcriptional regulator [Actinomadura chokoriensis]|uniref:BTAD domain-containing putative transcriptional regulator n=1 Tax=Actinomadura chokoriensis TaxID=454156 RepID=UPI0031F8E321